MLMGISSCCNKNKLTVDYGRTKKMRKCYTIIVLLFIISFLVSCSTVRYNIKRNKDLTVRQVNYFYKKMGMLFICVLLMQLFQLFGLTMKIKLKFTDYRKGE